MRCPKCTFISFDDLASCAKCSADLSVVMGELQGTCTENTSGFFLSPLIQTPDTVEEESFSDSQVLPPIDHGDVNFDETHTGGLPAPIEGADDSLIMNMDDSMEINSEDDVSIELGEIMPIDLSQLDSTQVLDGSELNDTESINLDDGGLDLDLTDSFGADLADMDATDESVGMDISAPQDLDDTELDLGVDDEEESIDLADIDLDETIDDSELDIDDDETSMKLGEVGLDESSDDELELDLNESDTPEGLSDADLEDTDLDFDTDEDEIEASTFDEADDELEVDLKESDTPAEVDDPNLEDSSLDLDVDIDEIDAAALDDTGETDVEDFTGDFPALDADSDDLEIGDELVAELTGDESDSFEDSDVEIEDLTGEFPSLELDDESDIEAAADNSMDDDGTPALSLEDIDVSDLVEDSAEVSDEETLEVSNENLDEEVDLSTLMDSAPSDIDEASDDLDLDMLDDQVDSEEPQIQVESFDDESEEDIPEIELIMDEEEGEDEGPPDLP